MKKIYLIIMNLWALSVHAYTTVGTDENCIVDSESTSIQALIDSGVTSIRITNQQVIYENLVIDKSVTINGGFNTCSDADSFTVGSTKTEFNGSSNGPVFAVSSPNDGSNQYFSVKNIAIRDGKNNGDHHGGGISVYDDADNFIQVTVEDSVIGNNQGTRGGGIYMKGDRIKTNLFHSFILNNLASSHIIGSALGGGVYCHSGEFVLNNGSGISFNQAYSSNEFTGHGGGIYATNSCDVRILSGSEGGLFDFKGINNNSASAHGGGVLAINSEITIDSNVHDNLININNNYADADNSGAGNGGGVFLSGSFMNIEGLLLSDNQAINGGGVYVTNNSIFSMGFVDNCGTQEKCNYLSGNTAAQDGGKGGLAYVDDGELYLRYGYITNNKADLGSVVYATNDSYVRGRAAMIYRNGGDNDGWLDEHVVYLDGGELNLTNVTLALNHAISATIKQENGIHDIFASIIFEPITNQISNFLNSTGVKNCLIVDNDFGIGGGVSNIIISDPKFVDPENDNYHISSESPAIDRCAYEIPSLNPVFIDIDGESYEYDYPEVDNGATLIDAGADELHQDDLIFVDDFEREEI